jgi:hypothetical protein
MQARKARLSLLAALFVTASAVAGMACNRSGAKLRDAASADLNCPPKEVHIIGASRTKDVEACGQRATYKFEDGDWVMVSREGAAPAAGAKAASPVKGPPSVTPAQPVTGTPSQPPPSPLPPSQPPPAAGQKAL